MNTKLIIQIYLVSEVSMIHGIGIDLIEIERIKKLLRNKRQVSKENFNTGRGTSISFI